jgi:WD40 repeat protein
MLLSHTARIAAQQECRVAVPTVPGQILFTSDQETYLGDVIGRSVNATNRVIEDDELAAPLRRIGARLVTNAGEQKLTPVFILVDLPEANAFTLPGGRIYVTKKLIAVARSEDELAGVLAHELGHALTRQIARDYSEMWRAVLNVNSLSDRADVEEKFHRFLETYATNPKGLRSVAKREEKEQTEADNFGIMLMVRAGYDPKSYADFFDRVTETRGKKGNWFSDLFGMTKPDAKRLREIIRNTTPVPANCANQHGKMTATEFLDWRHKIIAYSGFGKKELLPPSTTKRVLAEPLRSEIRNLQFSPDGKYLLAQDDASIYLMTREPFASLFRIDSDRAYDAKFTPNSKSVIFETEDERIEGWNVEQQVLESSYELHIPRPCMQSELSPLGDYLACVQMGEDSKFPMQLALLDVNTGEQVWVKKGVIDPTYFQLLAVLFGAKLRIQLEFSPDGRYLAGAGASGQFGYDLTTKQAVQLGKVRDYMHDDFVFLSGDTVLGINGDKGEKSAILKFPSGEMVQQIPTGFGSFYRVAKGHYVIVRPAVHAAAAVLDYEKKTFTVTSKTRAIDVYDDTIVSELVNGQLGLFHSPKEPPIAVLDLPKGPILRFMAVAVSPDLKYVAYSDWMRGAVWDVADGKRLSHVRGFRGAYFDANHGLYAEFPPADSYNSKGMHTKDEHKQYQSKAWKQEQRDKVGVEEVHWLPGTAQFQTISSVTNRFDVWQHGPYLIVSERITADGKFIEKRELEVRDATSGTKLWSRRFSSGLPGWHYNVTGDTFALVWGINDDGAKELMKSDPIIRAHVDTFKKKKGAILIEVLDHRTGNRRFTLPIDTGDGSFAIRDVDVVGNTVMLKDDQERLLVFNATGDRKGRIFGTRGVLDPTGKWLLAQVEPGRLGLFSIDDMQQKQTFTFGNRIAYMAFSADSKRLIVITTDQTFFTFTIG